MSHDIPVMVGTCRTEQSGFLGTDPTTESLTDAELKKRLDVVQRGKADEVYALYKRLFPAKSDAEILFMADTDRSYFLDSTILAGIRADAGGGKTYMYNFSRETPVKDGHYFVPHAEEIPFVFDSLEKGQGIVGPVTARRPKAWPDRGLGAVGQFPWRATAKFPPRPACRPGRPIIPRRGRP